MPVKPSGRLKFELGEQDMGSIVYVAEQGAIIKKAGRRIVIKKEKETLADIPVFKIEKVMIYGSVSITSGARDMLLSEGIDVGFLSTRGRFKGKLISAESANIYLRLAQYHRWNTPPERIQIARGIIASKMQSQLLALENYKRRSPEAHSRMRQSELRIRTLRDKIQSTSKIKTLTGYEGAASSAYFEGLRQVIKNDFTFVSRQMHPSLDPVNALLSLTYACLTNEVASASEARGFDPYLGFIHGIKYNRKSFSLDLVEEYRHSIGDRFVLHLINHRILKPDDFDKREKGAVFLKEDVVSVYFRQWDRWRRQKNDTHGSLPELIKRQLSDMETAILNGSEYKGLW